MNMTVVKKDFLEKAAKVSFASQYIEFKEFYGNKTLHAGSNFIEINTNFIIGSNVKRYSQMTWLDFLIKECRIPDNEYNGCIHKLASKILSALLQTDYLVFIKNQNIYLSDGHNRLIFIKFYNAIYEVNPMIKIPASAGLFVDEP